MYGVCCDIYQRRGLIMKKTFEAIWEHGRIVPKESIQINDHTRLLIVILDEQVEHVPTPGWRRLKGKYKNKLSSVDKFMQRKQEEKRLER